MYLYSFEDCSTCSGFLTCVCNSHLLLCNLCVYVNVFNGVQLYLPLTISLFVAFITTANGGLYLIFHVAGMLYLVSNSINIFSLDKLVRRL